MDYVWQHNSAETNFVYVILLVLPVHAMSFSRKWNLTNCVKWHEWGTQQKLFRKTCSDLGWTLVCGFSLSVPWRNHVLEMQILEQMVPQPLCAQCDVCYREKRPQTELVEVPVHPIYIPSTWTKASFVNFIPSSFWLSGLALKADLLPTRTHHPIMTTLEAQQ